MEMKISRRFFLAGAASTAIIIGSGMPAFGWNVHGVSMFNGGKSQVNLGGGGEYPFLNCLLGGQPWSWADNTNAPVTPDTLDANGYPTSIVHGGVATVFSVPSQLVRPGNYVATWTGNGTIAWSMSNTVLPTATFTGSQTAGVLTAGSPSTSIQKGMTLSVNGGIIGNQISGAVGAAGTYSVVGGANFGSQSLSVSGGSKTGSGGAGRYVFSTTANRFDFRITGFPVTGAQIFHVDDEALLAAGQVFQTKFKQRLQEANFGVIRFLNWQAGNITNVTTWATRKPTSYVFYSGYQLRPDLYAGVTTNVGNAYSVAAPSTWPGLVDKATVTININASATQSGTCTLNVGGTGDINILNEYSQALSNGGIYYPVGGTYQSMATLVYDALLNAWIKQGGDAASGSVGIVNGYPLELMVRLCTEVGAHPYFVAPPLACTPMTDWHTQLATYCNSVAPSWMVPRFEGPNELWNSSGGFYQTAYADAVGNAYGWGATDHHNWYGRAISTIGQAISAVYANNRAKYKVICGVQTAFGNSTGNTATHNPRLASTKYLLQTPQAGYTASAASAWVTDICCAQYFTPSDQSNSNITAEAAAFAGKAFTASISGALMTVSGLTASNSAAFAVGDTIFGNQVFQSGAGPVPTGVTIASFGTGSGGLGTYNISASLTVASMNMTGASDLAQSVTFANTSNSGSGSFTLSNCLTLYTNWKTWAQGFGIQKMCGYEGGYSPDYDSLGNSLADLLRSASKLAPNLNTFTTTNYNNFVGLTGGGFVAEFPSCFQFGGDPNGGHSQDAWSVLEDIYQSPNPPQWLAIIAFNH